MNRREFLTFGACAAAAKCFADAVPVVDLTGLSVDDFRRAIAVLESTRPESVEARAKALEIVQKYIYAMKTSGPYDRFVAAGVALSADEVRSVHASEPVLWWYDRAFEKVLDELKTTEVTGDVPAVWYVYNMGIVVKTKTCAFTIDLCHRRACELVPYVDFALVTHNHDDHWRPDFFEAMKKAGKPFVSNFALMWDWYAAEGKTIEMKGVTVHVTRTDHNPHLPQAVNCYEIECGGKKPFVIFHAGDTHRSDQLRPQNAVDLFFGHCAIGFSFPKAFLTTMPAKKMIIVHHQELGHLGGRWRCVGFHEEPAKIRRQFEALEIADRVAMPVWGDRIV